MLVQGVLYFFTRLRRNQAYTYVECRVGARPNTADAGFSASEKPASSVQRFEAAYVKCVKLFFGLYARLDIVTSMFFFIWVFLQLALSFTISGVDLVPAFRVIIT